MSHDTHHDHHAHQEEKPVLQFRTALFFVLTIMGLFVASIEFVKSMSHDDAGTHHGTEQHHGENKHANDAEAHSEGHH